MCDVDERFLEVRKFYEKDKKDVKLLDKAYETAKSLHENQIRKDGTPYITHPVEVALILAKLDFNVEVVSGALLHDVVEDCDYSIEELTENFGSNIAEMVDAVSAIDKTKYIYDEDEIYEDTNFIKSSAEEQTFKKLIAIGKKNPMGFAIKFADRLHNLRTIECFDYNKQLEKVRESERWIIPIAEKLNAEMFFREIKNECFKIVNKEGAKQFLEHYHVYHKTNEYNIEALKYLLNEAFSKTCIHKIDIHNIKEYKVYSDLQELFPKRNIGLVSQGQILKVANYNIYCLHNNETNTSAIETVINTINKSLANKLKIIDVKIGRFTGKVYYQIEDEIRNKYNLYIMSEGEYVYQMIGALEYQADNLIDEDNINNLSIKYIKVKTRSGEVKFIPENSTVLDFAFKLHQDIGFGFNYAIINGSKTHHPPYTKLNDGDKVEIFVLRNAYGKIINAAKIKWFAYVNTELSKKRLIKHFEQIQKEP